MAAPGWVYRVCKTILILICVILFFVIMARIGKKFQDSQWKALARLGSTYEELPLPEVTVCSSKPYKGQVLSYFSTV